MSKHIRFTPLIAFIVMTLALASPGQSAPAVLPKKKVSAKAVKSAAKLAPPAAAPSADKDTNDEDSGTEPEVAPRRTGVGIDAASAIRLNYGRNSWNRSSTQVDAAAVFLKEGATGRIVQIEVEETAPDSAVFSGTYSINAVSADPSCSFSTQDPFPHTFEIKPPGN